MEVALLISISVVIMEVIYLAIATQASRRSLNIRFIKASMELFSLVFISGVRLLLLAILYGTNICQPAQHKVAGWL